VNDRRTALTRAQREAVEALKHELYGRDPVAGSRYVRDFHDEFRTFQRISSYDDLLVACYKADVVLVGDYHALPDQQRFAARLLEDLSSRSERTLLALEMVYAMHQAALDAWLAGRSDDEELRARIRYDLDWSYDWEGPARLLETARRLGVRVLGVDGPPRGGLPTLHRRDALAAARLAEICQAHPGAHVVVVFGESHLARGHLPRRLGDALRRRGLERKLLRVVQDVDDIYWELLERGLEHREVVLVGDRTFAVFGGSPLRKYEAFRRTLERWNAEEEDEGPDLGPTVHAMVDTILRYLEVNPARRRVGRGGPRMLDAYPEVYGRNDLLLVARILASSGLDRGERAAVLCRVRQRGSCYVPRANMVLLGTLRLTDAGEESSHFVHQALCGGVWASREPAKRHDVFYREVMEEAIGYFGSKLIDPSRNLFFEEALYRERRTRAAGAARTDADRVLEFVLAHRRLERERADLDRVPPEVLEAIHENGRLTASYAHQLGYFLGHRLYEAHRAGRIDHRGVRSLFRRRFDRPGEAIDAYFSLVPLLED
jgi:uncharacterized iron-regulated protein